jgi:hypothetical protein
MSIKYETSEGSPSFVENNDLGHKWIKWANYVTLEKDYMSFCPKIISLWEIVSMKTKLPYN